MTTGTGENPGDDEKKKRKPRARPRPAPKKPIPKPALGPDPLAYDTTVDGDTDLPVHIRSELKEHFEGFFLVAICRRDGRRRFAMEQFYGDRIDSRAVIQAIRAWLEGLDARNRAQAVKEMDDED